jgi:hypothetical protein
MIVEFDTALPEYAPPHERPVLQKLTDMCLENDNRVSVWDGEELSVQGCNNKANILKNLAQTEMDQLEVFDKGGNYLGFSENVYRRLDEAFGGYEL